MISKTVSHYRIIEKLGAGGMGVVYKAEDTRLKRTVALKFLPPELTRDAEAKTRFIREAQAASSLDHPNICTIHEINETEDGQMFIVMACYEGEILKSKIDKGKLQTEIAINYSSQILEGLTKAHEKGIVHRDIKPANIFITKDNIVKILDFGLAKLAGQAQLTKDSSTLGTVAYMSPEQAQGNEVDNRTDIWSFGVVLYEMLTGELPFKGEYDQAVVYSILNENPEPVSRSITDVPIELENIINKAIAKKTNERYQHIGEIKDYLLSIKNKLTINQEENRFVRQIKNDQRKPAAIMFTDMVDYSTVAKKNESLALDLLEENRKILHEIFPIYDGKEIETVRDAFFIEFSSALEAVRCAIEIQKTLFDRNESVNAEKEIRIRIGIHSRDVVYRGINVLDDGVNIASRIEPLAETEGIAISQDVAILIQNKIDLPLKKLDKSKLKNIQLPAEVYYVELPWKVKKQKTASVKVDLSLFRFKRYKTIVMIILVIVLVGMGIYLFDFILTSIEIKNSIAVLPFKNMSGKIENEYFSDGITEDVITHLSKIAELKVISRTSVMQYKNTEKNLRDIGNELNVANILEGSVRRDDNTVRIAAQLIDARNDEHLWVETYDKELTQIFSIQSEVAEEIAKSLKAKISPSEKVSIERKATKNLEAYDLYLKGRFHLNKRLPDDLEESIDYFEKALEIDPNFALAYSGLADSYIILGNYYLTPPYESFQKAKAAAEKALEINENLAEAHTSYAYAIVYTDWDWTKAEIEFNSAIELNPNLAQTYGWYGFYLTLLGRFEEAAVMREKALDLDPFSVVINMDIGLELYFERKYDQAIIQNLKTLEINPATGVLSYIQLGSSYLEKSMFQEALKSFSTMSRNIAIVVPKGHPIPIAALGYAYAMSGRIEDANNMLELLLEKSEEEYVPPYWIAVVYTGLGDNNNAFKWLDKAYEEKDGSMVFLKVIPIFDSLRSDERYTQLLSKMGL
jgi:serine/threonine protein kinase/TolB-like protein/Tfp pilus assembly protein PilF